MILAEDRDWVMNVRACASGDVVDMLGFVLFFIVESSEDVDREERLLKKSDISRYAEFMSLLDLQHYM